MVTLLLNVIKRKGMGGRWQHSGGVRREGARGGARPPSPANATSTLQPGRLLTSAQSWSWNPLPELAKLKPSVSGKDPPSSASPDTRRCVGRGLGVERFRELVQVLYKCRPVNGIAGALPRALEGHVQTRGHDLPVRAPPRPSPGLLFPKP